MRRVAAGFAAAAVVLALPFALDAKPKKRPRRKEPEPTAVPRPPDPYRVTIPTADGVLLAASWRPQADAPDAPAVLLLHEFARERRALSPLAARLRDRGFATLAVDLRGHGESTKKSSGAAVKLSPRLLTDPEGFPRDVDAALLWLKKRSPHVGVLGIAIGGNLAVLATAARGAEAGVAVSTTVERFELLAGGRSRTPRAMLLLAAEGDPGRADSAKALAATGEAPLKVMILGGAAHGLVLLEENPEARGAAVEWLAERLSLPPRPTPTPAPSPDPDRTPAASVPAR